jgi:hypothetical protein
MESATRASEIAAFFALSNGGTVSIAAGVELYQSTQRLGVDAAMHDQSAARGNQQLATLWEQEAAVHRDIRNANLLEGFAGVALVVTSIPTFTEMLRRGNSERAARNTHE